MSGCMPVVKEEQLFSQFIMLNLCLDVLMGELFKRLFNLAMLFITECIRNSSITDRWTLPNYNKKQFRAKVISDYQDHSFSHL